MRAKSIRSFRRQQGAALLVGMIFLLVTTVIAVVAIGSTVLQERMTGGQRNDSLAQQGSESALRGAERMLWTTFSTSDGHGVVALRAEPLSADARNFRESSGWVATGTAYANIDYDAITLRGGSGRLDRAPRFVVERLDGAFGPLMDDHGSELSATGLPQFFRVTTRSTGGDARVIRTNESVYAVAK